MRKETRAAAEAFLSYDSFIINEFRGQPPYFTGKRTIADKGELLLHGHMIAWHQGQQLALCLCGYRTNTTLDRLNGILELAHGQRPLFIRKGKVYYGTLAREVGAREVLLLPRYLPEEVT